MDEALRITVVARQAGVLRAIARLWRRCQLRLGPDPDTEAGRQTGARC